MALKIVSTQFNQLKKAEFNRFDPKYYLINYLFNNLSTTNHYKVQRLDELNTSIVSGSYIDEYVRSDEGIAYLRVMNVKPFCINEQEEGLVYINKKVSAKMITKQNDIILGRTQATIGKLGVSSIIDKQNEGLAISQHLSKITIADDTITPYYLIAYLNSRFAKAQMAIASHGDTRVELTLSQLRSLKVLIPSEEVIKKIEITVRKIIEFNRKSNSLIKIGQNIVFEKLGITFPKEELTNFFSVNSNSLINCMWTPRFSLPLYNNTIRVIKEKSKTVELKGLVTIKKGNEVGSENYTEDLEKEDSYLPFIRTSDLINFEVDQFPDYFISDSIYEELNQDIKPYDVLYNNDGKVGIVAMVTPQDRFILQSHIQRIRLKKEAIETYKLTQEYLFLILSIKEIGKYQAEKYTVIQSTIPTISNHIVDFVIPVLDENTINKVTEVIKEAFRLKDEKKKLIKNVKEEIDSYFHL